MITNVRFQMATSLAVLNPPRAGLMSSVPLQHKTITKLDVAKCLQYTRCKAKVSNCVEYDYKC